MRIYTQITVEDHNFFPVVAWISKQGTEKEREKKKKKGYHSHVGSMTLTHVAFGERAQRDNSVFAKKKKHGRGCTCQLNLSGLAGSTEFLIVFILL